MTDSDHDLLIQLNTKFDLLYEDFRRTSNGTGFPRCVERQERLESLEEQVKNIKGKFWWAFTVGATALLGLLTTILKGAINP